MKRYFEDTENKQTIMVEFTPNSCIRGMKIRGLFGREKGLVELTKSEYRRKSFAYEKENETNLKMIITR